MKLVSHCGTSMNVAHLKSIRMFFLGYMRRSRTFWTLNSFKAWNMWHFAIFRIVSFSQHLTVTNLPMRLEKKKPWKWLSTPQFRKSMGVVRKTIQQRWDDATLMQPQLAKKGSLFLKKIFIFTNMMGDLYKPNIQNYDYITVYNNWISKWCLKSKYLTSKQQYC